MDEAIVEQSGLTVRREQATGQFVIHCATNDAAAISACLPVALPSAMLRMTAAADWRALHLAPDEWLLIGPDGGRLDLKDAPAPYSLVDVSHRSASLRIEGEDAALLLNSGCPLDLSAINFPAGACTRTLFGKVQIMLERAGDCFRMQHGRSFDRYVTAFIRQAAMDLPGQNKA